MDSCGFVLPGLKSIGCFDDFWCCLNKWSKIAPYSSWIRCISFICSATFSIPFKASEISKFFLIGLIINHKHSPHKGDLPTRCKCSSAWGSVKFRNCCSNSGYFRILWIGLIRYDSNVLLCCCFGLRAVRNSWSAWLPSSLGFVEKNKNNWVKNTKPNCMSFLMSLWFFFSWNWWYLLGCKTFCALLWLAQNDEYNLKWLT